MEGYEKVGGIIAAAQKKIWEGQALSMRPVGSISAIRRIVTAMQKAGVRPIVVITGYDADVLEHELAKYPVYYLHLHEYESCTHLEALQSGIRYLSGKCGSVLFAPVDVPLFCPDTVCRLMETDTSVAAPSFHGQGGHPLFLRKEVFPVILGYTGPGSIIDALAEEGICRTWIDVDDRGIFSIFSFQTEEELISTHSNQLFRPFLRIRIGKESAFMGGRVKLLLSMIDETHSVREACEHLQISYSKAWVMLNQLEQGLGYPVVSRRHGGRQGGRTYLTEEGISFLSHYIEFENSVYRFAEKEFDRIFCQAPGQLEDGD